MIFTRSAFPGIQRYGSVFWSGDVGNDWETLRRQIVSGLGLVSTGLPWWTYDAGGFFRPGNQYNNPDYIECMLRWIQAGTFLPLMRVHGYMSDTEPWRYGKEAEQIIAKYLEIRYRLLPYIYSEAARVSYDGSTLMRPLVFDFAHDEEALKQDVEYMFGPSMLINPVVEKGATVYKSYLPENVGGWYDYWTGKLYNGNQYVNTDINIEKIPIFIKAGSIIPFGPVKQYVAEKSSEPISIHIYPGADATFCLYEDEGVNHNYESGACSRIALSWNEGKQTLTIGKRQGEFEGMQETQTFVLVKGNIKKEVSYTGKKMQIKL
jgi:alpha-D-xyloside xylohydrolase